jgi:hypothetical protein
MVMASPPIRPDTRVFVIACWTLGLIAFGQIWIAGLSLMQRFQQAGQPKVVEKEVIRHVILRVPAESTDMMHESAIVSRPPTAPTTQSTPATQAGLVRPLATINPLPALPAPRPLDTPPIADPRCERLVQEAREARVAGDMGKAIVKLEEALSQVPHEPAVLFELGIVHEQMGVFDHASGYYQKVFELGTSGAGTYYEAAAAKLRDGFENPADNIGRLSLGRVRIFKTPDPSKGETVLLTIPVQKAPSFEVNPDDLSISVVFFNRTSKGEIIQLEEPSWVREKWVSLPFDWAGSEELLRMTYTIPPQDQQTEHLFGVRSYHGQVVSLTYQGEILDVQAWPRDLAARLPGTPARANDNNQFPDFLDLPPPDFDPDLGVLPPLPE